MKKIKFNWTNDRVTILWPDHPLVMAGSSILSLVVQQIENGLDSESISTDISKKLGIKEEEVNAYVKHIFGALKSSGVLLNGSKELAKIDKLPDQNNLSMATINITRKCNLSCNHCYARGDFSSFKREMSIQEIHDVVAQLGKLINSKPRLLIISGGEPTLEKDKLKTAVLTAVEYGLSPRLNTNGYFIDDKLAKFLAFNKVIVQVSIDGIDAKTHALLRGIENSFNIAISAIKRLVDVGCRARISFTVHSENFNQIPEMIDFAQNLGAEQFTTSSLVGIGNALQNNLKTVEFEKEFFILYEAVKLSYEKQLMTRYTLLAEIISAIRAGIRFTYCGTGYNTCCVDSDGSLYPCINMLKDVYRAGNVINERFDSIWKSSDILKKLRELNVDCINSKCAKCIFRYFCGGYCRGETVEGGHSLSAPYIRCESWKKGLMRVLNFLSETPDIYNFNKNQFSGGIHHE